MMDPVSVAADVGWGVSVAGWLVSPVISKLLDRCFSYLASPSSSAKVVEELQRKILQLKLILEATSEECPHQRTRVEQWAKELKTAFYEAEDILDDIDYHHLKNRVHCQAVDTTKLQDFETMMDFNVSTESRKELMAILNKLENLIEEGHQVLSLLKLPATYEYINNTANDTVTLPRATSNPPVVFGRDGDLDMIRKWLHDTHLDDEPSSRRTKCYSVIGIHGSPGSGKTTLAQYVCEREREEDYFNLIMWIHVSQNFCVDTIFAEMLEEASGRKRRQLSDLDRLRFKVQAMLRGKRFLLILDDFCYGKDASGQLDLLLSPLNVAGMGSKIMVTTRTVDAARALGARNLVAVPDNEQFFSMFMYYALDGATISDQALLREHQSIGRKIAEKLGRSPLAARIVAGQLRQRLDFDFWTSTMNSEMLNNGTMATLWWSYQQLEEHVKRCFAYCSVFPRAYELQRDELVHLWMAEGFVETTKETEDMEDVGHDYFHVLLSASFIQLKRKEFGKEYFTIHDLLHDLAERVSGSDSFRIEKGMVGTIHKDVRHLFIASYDERVFQEEILNMKSLRTLIMSPSSKCMDIEDFRSMLKSLKKLRVVLVQVDSLSTISPCIGQQKHLRYLGILGGIAVLTLPRRFTELYHLQKFAVRCTTHVCFYFNDEIANLVNLRHMICRAFVCPYIGRLTLLRTLPVFCVKKQMGYEMQQLAHLDNLRGTLIIEALDNVESKEEASQAKLANKVYLSGLVLQWNNHDSSQELDEGRTCEQSSDSQQEVLESLHPPSVITSLKIKNYKGSAYPSWFSREQDALKDLQHLELSNCYAPPKIGESFVHLRTLVISDCVWHSLPENMEHLILLEKLVIVRCANILCLPLLPLSLKVLTLERWEGSSLPENMEHLTSFEELTLEMCDNIRLLPRLPLSLKKLRLWGGIDSLPEGMECLMCLEELALRNCDNIHALPSLPLSLKKLEISKCNLSLTKTCLTDGHPNFQKIVHVKNKHISEF